MSKLDVKLTESLSEALRFASREEADKMASSIKAQDPSWESRGLESKQYSVVTSGDNSFGAGQNWHALRLEELDSQGSAVERFVKTAEPVG